MAPSPEHDKEPKAPDKNDNKSNDSADIRNTAEIIDNSLNSTNSTDGTALQSDTQESSVSTLDDVQLKSLLDEAINYKTPKDREGKSQIFKDLLQEAEEDERNARAASASGPQLARYYNTAAIGAARRHRNRKETTASSTLTHGGSLQDLAQSDLYTDSHNVSGGSHSGSSRRSGGRRHRQNHPVTGQKTVSVSARQREGGSLPSNVNAGARNLLFDDYVQHKTKNKKDEIISNTSTVECEINADIKPEYTIVELGSVSSNLTDTSIELSDISIQSNCNNIDLSESADETRSLLMKETRNYSTLETNQITVSSGNSNDVNVPKYRYPHGDVECPNDKDDTPLNTQQSVVNNNNNNTTKRSSNYEQHQVSRHQYFNPLEEYNKLPRIKYTSMAKVEIDGLNSQMNTNVDKAISFSQFSSERDVSGSLQLDADYSSVRCIVDGAAAPIPTENTAATTTNATPTTTTVVSTVSGRAHALTKLSSDYRLLALPTNTKTLDRFKGLDENGNSLQSSTTVATTGAGGSFDAKKKSKKSKVDRNVSVLDAKDIAGHQADIIQDIDQLVKYIEENDDKSAATKGKHSHHVKNNNQFTSSTSNCINNNSNTNIESTKKPKRIKTKSETGTPKSNLKKSNSLEEISKTKFADLMNSDHGKRGRVKKQSTSEDGDFNAGGGGGSCKKEERDRRSWGSEDSQQYVLAKQQRDSDATVLVGHETAEFHVVTKKKKSKKRTTSSSSRFDEKNSHHYHYHKIENSGREQHYNNNNNNNNNNNSSNRDKDRSTANSDREHHHHHHHHHHRSSVPTRRKSACSVPPSDKSGESSDVDSVHSLPAATTRRPTNKPTNEQTTTSEFNDTLAALVAVGNTSYADIARNNNIIQYNQQPQQQKSSIALKSSEHFPELLCTLEKQNDCDEIVTKEEEFPALLETQQIDHNIIEPLVKSSRDQTATIKQSSGGGGGCCVNKSSDVRVVKPTILTNNNIVGRRPPPTTPNQLNNRINRAVPPTATATTTTATASSSTSTSTRPAVIILNDSCPTKDDLTFVQQSPSEPIQVSGLTFGFELNEQLLNDEFCEKNHYEQPQQEQDQQHRHFCARFLAPPGNLRDNYNHDKIVQFIGMAWEELIHDNKGKIQYYNGQ